VIAQNNSGETVPQAWIAGAVMLEGGEALPTAPDPGPPADMRRLRKSRFCPNRWTAVCATYSHAAKRPAAIRAFTKIGDCNTDTSHFRRV
jgi:hypothetical protein